jgi:phage tail-like protein
MRRIELRGLERPIAMLADAQNIYIADGARRRLLSYPLDIWANEAIDPLGEAQHLEASILALTFGSNGQILLNCGGAFGPVTLDARGAYVPRGVMYGGPFHSISVARNQWHRLKAFLGPQPAGTHIRIHVALRRGVPAPEINFAAAQPFAAAPWQALPLDAPECLFKGWIPSEPEGDRLPPVAVHVGIEFQSEGADSPALAQMRLDFDHRSYVSHLPQVYSKPDAAVDPQIDQGTIDPRKIPSAELVLRLLSLLDGAFSDVERALADLPRQFDPAATRANLLQWLAGWLAIDFDESMDEARRRDIIANAYAVYANRGTPHGLRQALRLFAGVDARVDEPLPNAEVWVLTNSAETDAAGPEPTSTRLGINTMLASSEPQGAVLGNAILDQSQVARDEEFGMPLTDDLAHRFTVRIYPGRAGNRRKREIIEKLVDLEKPAHVLAHVCTIEPAMRVGFQARLGVDSIVGHPTIQQSALGFRGTDGNLVLTSAGPARLGPSTLQIGDTLRSGTDHGS